MHLANDALKRISSNEEVCNGYYGLFQEQRTPLENEQNDDKECEFNKLRLNNASNIIKGHLKCNSFPGKCD